MESKNTEIPPGAEQELAQVRAEIEQDLGQEMPPGPVAAAPAPTEQPAGFQFTLSSQGKLKALVDWYAVKRGKQYTMPEVKAAMVAAPLDQVLNAVVNRYMPAWAKERPELLAAAMVAWNLSDVLLEIEAAPALPAPSAPAPGQPAPVIASQPASQDRMPSPDEISREAQAR